MINYYLDTEPDTKGEFYLHTENCILAENLEDFVLLENFERNEDILKAINKSDYAISFCQECIGVNFDKPLIDQKSKIMSLLNLFKIKK